MRNIEYRNLAIAIAELETIKAQLGAMFARYMANEYMPDEAIEEVFNAQGEIKRAIANLSEIHEKGEDIYVDVRNTTTL